MSDDDFPTGLGQVLDSINRSRLLRKRWTQQDGPVAWAEAEQFVAMFVGLTEIHGCVVEPDASLKQQLQMIGSHSANDIASWIELDIHTSGADLALGVWFDGFLSGIQFGKDHPKT